ncbi:hypothetical protein SNEBB_003997 [Seison nebaliae]|nr:hypothetical protein SNEBB_003997 [Seison nebaliae]
MWRSAIDLPSNNDEILSTISSRKSKISVSSSIKNFFSPSKPFGQSHNLDKDQSLSMDLIETSNSVRSSRDDIYKSNIDYQPVKNIIPIQYGRIDPILKSYSSQLMVAVNMDENQQILQSNHRMGDDYILYLPNELNTNCTKL